MLRFVFMFLACAILLAPQGVTAQISTDIEPIDIHLTPRYPKPYETVTVTPGSTIVDLSASTVTISADGKILQKGTGTQGAAIQVGAAGETTTVTVTVSWPDGRQYSKQLTIRPGGVSLVVEPVSTTHPFYKGLSLVAPESRVRLIAIPDLRTSAKNQIDPATLIYTWRFGDRVLESSSGIGRSVLVATAPLRYRDADIVLTVTSPDQNQVAEASVTISPVAPLVRMYAFDPLRGPDYDNAIDTSFMLIATEASFRAVPYFFAANPTLEWSVGGTAQGAQKDITVRSTGSGQGSATLEIRAKLVGALQVASNRTLLRFGEGKSPLSIFGF